jgi:hypothetical protein
MDSLITYREALVFINGLIKIKIQHISEE